MSGLLSVALISYWWNLAARRQKLVEAVIESQELGLLLATSCATLKLEQGKARSDASFEQEVCDFVNHLLASLITEVICERAGEPLRSAHQSLQQRNDKSHFGQTD